MWFDKIKENSRSYVVRVRWKNGDGKTNEKQKSFKKERFSKREVQNLIKEIEVRATKMNKDKMVYNPFDWISSNPYIPLSIGVESYLEDYKEKVAENTFKIHNQVLTYFTEEVGGTKVCNAITFEDIADFINDRCTNYRSKNTYLTPFRNLFKYLEDEFDVPNNIKFQKFGSRKDRRKKNNEQPVILSETELQELVESSLEVYKNKGRTEKKDILSWVVYFYVGMRTEQLAWTKLRDIKLDENRIHIGRNRTTKNYKPRLVYLPKGAHQAITYMMEGNDEDDFLIDHERMDAAGRVMRPAYFKFKRMYEKVFPSKPSMPMYNLRHSCGCWMIEEGFNVMFIRNQLGHKDLNQINTYLHMTGRSQKDAITKHVKEQTNLNTYDL